MQQATQGTKLMQALIALLLVGGGLFWAAAESGKPLGPGELKVEAGDLRSYLAEAMMIADQAAADALAEGSNERDGIITIINTQTDQVVSTLCVGGRPRGIPLCRDGQSLYLALFFRSNERPDRIGKIALIDAASGRISTHHAAGTDPEQCAVNHDGARRFISNENAVTAWQLT